MARKKQSDKDEHVKDKLQVSIQRYLKGNCTSEEQQMLERWYDNQADRYPWQPATEQYILACAKRAIFTAIKGSANRKTSYFNNPLWAIAACFMLLIGAGISFYHYSFLKHDESIIYTTGTGKKRVSLADGTAVHLDAGSELRLLPGFAHDKRIVELSGQAFFDVKADPDKPFVVYAAGVPTHVLGTSFNVKCFDTNKGDVEVAVASGKVRAADTEIQQGQYLKYNVLTRKGSLFEIDTDKIGSWYRGILYFEEATLQEIVNELARAYNVQMELSDSNTTSCRYTFHINNENLENVLKLLKTLTGINYQMKKNQIFMESKQCI